MDKIIDDDTRTLRGGDDTRDTELSSLSDAGTITPTQMSTVPLLHTLAQQGDLTRIRGLLDDGEAQATVTDAEGITALHWAAMNMHIDVCKLLLERGAEVDAVGGQLTATPLHWASR